MRINKKAAAVAVAAVTLAGSGLAYAYWTTTGDGTGSASTGTTSPYTIVNQATTGDPLSPDGPVQNATFNVHNPGSGVQQMSQVVVTVADANGDPWTSGTCSADDFKLGTSAAGASYTIANVESLAPGGDSIELDVDVHMVDTGSDQDDCQSITDVPLFYDVS